MRVSIHREGDWFHSALFRFTWSNAATQFADTVGPKVRDRLAEACPRKPGWDHPERGVPGRMANSITYRRESDPGDSVNLRYEAHTPYAGYVVHGTTPHEIRPVAARALHWVDLEGEHFRARVSHPGNQANRFPDRVLAEERDSIVEDFTRAVTDAFRE